MAVDARTSPLEQLRRAKKEGWRYDGTQATEGEVLELLCALVQVTKPDVVVETGTYNGHGSRALSVGLELNGKGHLWSVENDPEITVQLKDVELERTTWVDADSIEWSRDTELLPDFCWIDCCAEPSERVKVFENLWPKVNEGGLACVHDIFFYRGEDLLEPLCEIAGPPNLCLPALNGVGVWVN